MRRQLNPRLWPLRARRLVPWALLACALITMMGALVSAQAAPDQRILRYRQEIEECRGIVSHWEYEAILQIVLIVAVIVFGASITALQASKKGWCKATTIVLGACTSIFTGINAKVFSADYRVLQRSAIDARDLIDQLETVADRLPATQSAKDRIDLEGQWVKTMGQFRGLWKDVVEGTRHTASLFTNTVYAQGAIDGPVWAQHPPADAYNFYFVGHGEDSSIGDAQRLSFDHAVEEGVRRLMKKNTDLAALRRFIAAFSNVENSSFSYDKATRLYHYYTLLRLNKEVQNLSFPSANEPTKRKIREHELGKLLPDLSIYVYLREIGVDRDISDLYLVSSQSIAWAGVSEMSPRKFSRNLRDLRQVDSDLQLNTFIRKKMVKGDSLIVTLPSGSALRIDMLETHYIKGWVEISVSRSS